MSASAAHRGSTRTLPPTPYEASVQAQGSDSRHVKRDEFVPKRILFASQHSNTSSGSRHWPPNESFVQTIDSRHVRGDEIIPQTNPFSKLPTRDMQGATKLSPNEFFPSQRFKTRRRDIIVPKRTSSPSYRLKTCRGRRKCPRCSDDSSHVGGDELCPTHTFR